MIDSAPQFELFETELGWSLMAGSFQYVEYLSIGGASAEAVFFSWYEQQQIGNIDVRQSSSWYGEARELIERYAAGEDVSFETINCDLTQMTPFQQQVLNFVRTIPRGQVLTYGEVAKQVGRPKAARAIGATMARNPIPLIIPCHRVVGSDGRMTGFSAPQGIALKQRLLDMERAESKLPF